MLKNRIRKSFFHYQLLLVVCLLSAEVKSFLNSPKIITKDGNLIFESGMNRNITFRLNGKSRLTINDQYDLMDLIYLRSGAGNGSRIDMNGGENAAEWLEYESINPRQLYTEVSSLKMRVFGPQGIDARLRELQNSTTNANQALRRYQGRLQRIETRIQELTANLERDRCASNPCENGGTCYNMYNSFMCKCTKNFEGPMCEKDVNECALFAGTDLGCQNGGQCVNQFGGYSCICTPGWFGIHCAQRKGDCLQSSAWELCGHGTCVPAAGGNDNFGYKCICDQGWKTNGLTPSCTVDVDECTETPHTSCSTKCINLPGSFTCAPCQAGLEGNGMNCRDIDECATNNGGCSVAPKVPCINTYGSYHCGECPLGWIGDGRVCTRSDTNENGRPLTAKCTDGNVCFPGATCNEISNTIACSCPDGMVGSGFGANGCVRGTAKNCGSFPCLNGGTCIDSGNSFVCLCPMGFVGPNCLPLPSPCIPNPCHNNGQCTPSGGTTFTCQCAPGYTGRLCDGRFSRCGGILSGTTGRLKYPEGSQYEHNAQCAWLLRTNDTKVLNVTFNAFELEDASECRYDWLQINDGRSAAARVIGRFCGSNKPMGGNLISTANYLYLWFRSDNSTAREGFELEWNSIAPQCGGIISVESHGTIASPGSPGVYPKNRDCRWLLRAPNDKRIKLTFFSLQIENHTSCNFDFVEIYDAVANVFLEKFCTTSRPAPVLLPTNEAIIHFHSDDVGDDTGFQIYYSLEERLPGCGGTFTTKQGTIKSPVLNGDSMSCEYDIKMTTSESITIEFTKFEMGQEDCIEIYDINQEKQINDLQSKYCGGYNFLPSTFHSLFNSVRIKYYSKGGGFELKYKADCSYTFNSESGVVMSPGYPELSKDEHFCSYKILTEPNTVISLTFADFELRDSSLEENDCTYSFLRLNDGPDQSLMGPYCNEDQPPMSYVTKSNMLMLLFQSGATSSGKGFKLEYKAIPMKATDCGGVFTKPGYTIRLPTGENGEYLHNLECYFVIMAPQGKGISIAWKSFSMEATFDCTYDYIEIFDNLGQDGQKPLGRYCDARPPPSFFSHSRLLTIKFVSDYSDAADGFEATYDFVDTVNQCGGKIFASTGKLYSYGWPQNYTNGKDCIWVLTTPSGTQLELEIIMFELEGEHNNQCDSDWLEIRNGGSANSSLIGKFCDRNIPKSIPSFTNQLHLHFHSDNFINARGFEISWEVRSDGCGGVVKAENGVITSPFYPQPYPNEATCEWRIHVRKGSAIKIVIDDIAIEELFQCNYDYLEIFDGSNADKAIAKICQPSSEQQEFLTTSSEALLRFITDSSNTERGFHLSYSSICTRTITEMHGAIESLNFDSVFYANAVNCSWTLKAPKGNKIMLEFTHFENVDGESIYFIEKTNNGSRTLKIKNSQNFESIGDTLMIVHNDSDVKFRLEYKMFGCIQSLTRESGSFHSPNHPKTYPNDVECVWDIKVPLGNGIKLDVHQLDIQDSVNCTKDALQISFEADSKNPKERHCGKQNSLTVTTSGHRLYVRFYSDSSINGLGFDANYEMTNITCGGEIAGRNGIVTSPNYPLNYPPNIFCEWKISVPSHHTMILTIVEMEIEDFYDCEMDHLSAYEAITDEEDSEEERKLFTKCGNIDDSAENTWRSTGNEVTLRFNTDDSSEMKGFKLHFEESCGGTLTIADDYNDYLSISKHTATGSCEWTLISKNISKHIFLQVTHVQVTTLMSMQSNADCSDNGIRIYDGKDASAPLREKFCKTHPAVIISNGHALTIKVNLTAISEFEAEYLTMDNTCGGYFTTISGKFSSPYYPSSYPVNIECEYYLRASSGNSLILTIESLDLEDSDDCNNDYLEVREDLTDGKKLGVFCGTQVPEPIKGYSSLWVKFNSDNNNVGKGFLASYNYATHNELSEEGTIESPRYPTIFHVDEPYSWRITVDKDYVVLLTINHIVDVDIPFIKFYDGYSDIGVEIDYSESHVVRSHTNILYFTASRGPFLFEWERLGKDAVRANTSSEESIRNCGKELILVEQPVLFSSPGYPEGYSDNLDCSWKIMAQNPATHVVLQLTKIDLEEFSDCFADYVAVSSGSNLDEWKRLDKLCKKEPTTVKSYIGSPYLKLDFHTDSSNNKTGFASYIRTSCGSEITDRQGFVNITSLAVGSEIFQMDCVWTIKVRQGRRVRVTFVDSLIRNPNDTSGSCNSYFLIRDGIDEYSPFLGKGKFCDNDISDILDSKSNRVYIKFARTGFPKFQASFHFEEISHECSEEITLTDEPSGRLRTIMSPNYPNIANPHTECIWRITAPVHRVISIDFIGKFELTTGTGPVEDACDREYVQLNDGATNMMPIIGRYCGTTNPNTAYSTGNILRVTYYTDVVEPKAGFMANVSIASCGGFYYGSEGTVRSPVNLNLQGKKEFVCVYTFEATPDSVVQIAINMELPDADNCTEVSHLELQEIDAYGEVENITDTLKICGHISKRYVVETNKLAVRYVIKENSHTSDTFTIDYKMLGSRCGETIVASTGVLQTPGYPNGVARPTHCIWRLRVPKGRRVKIEFLDFDTGSSLVANNSIGESRTFRGRITFANDFQMHSIIARITDNPPQSIYSTDNTMAVNAFLLSIGRHRGFKMRFSSLEESIVCRSRMVTTDMEVSDFMQFRGSNEVENFCSYRLIVPKNRTLAITIDNYKQYEEVYLGGFLCELYAPMRFERSGEKLMKDMFCQNTTFPITLRLPYSIDMQLLGNRRNHLSSIDVKTQLFSCGGLLPVYPYYIGENSTITEPKISNYNDSLECAWAFWPSGATDPDDADWNLEENSDFQLDISLSTNFKGKCEEQYLLLYNGPTQDSPQIGRYCGVIAISNVIAREGLFVEYHTKVYERESSFNLTTRPGSGCGGKLTYPYRKITFDRDYYQNNVECIWELVIERGFHLAAVFFDRFFIESSPDCRKDYLKFQQRDSDTDDWQDIKTLCGRDPDKSVNSSMTQMRLIFRSDGDTLGDGFNIEFERNCGGIFYATKELQQIKSPGYPNEMTNNLYCNYTIISKDSGNKGVLVRFKEFDLESPPTSKCLFDNVTVISYHNEEQVEKVLCGNIMNREYRSDKIISLIVQTDQTFASKGFLAEYSTNLCGGLVTTPGLIETPHEYEDNNFPPNSNCFWNITAPAYNKILIKFELVEFEAQSDCAYDSVEVYKGDIAVFDQRVAKFCGNMTGQLPILSIATNKAIIRSHSDERDPSKGFKALISFKVNCDREIFLGPNNATYQFNVFSGSYGNNIDCSYLFRTDPGYQLQIDFSSFHVENETDCTSDYLEIRDGAGPFADEIGRFCGHSIPPRLMASRHVLFMSFVSDKEVTSAGFAAQITSVPLICGSHIMSLDNTAKSNLVLKSPENSDGNFKKNINCFWKIKSNSNIHLKFDKFDVQSPKSNTTCGENYLKIYNSGDASEIEKGYGTELVFNGKTSSVNYINYATEHIYCGNHLPDDYFSTSHEIFLKFKSDDSGSGGGFSLTAMPAQGCYRNFTGTQGRILIADTSDHCDLYLKAPENYTLSLYFSTVSFSEYDCEVEYLEVFDARNNSSLRKICSYMEPAKSLFTFTNELRMRIKMSSHYTEFDITYLASQNGPGCGGDFYNTAGVFTNPFYPENVRNNSDCLWNIRVPRNLRIFLRFDAFDLGAKTTCISDYLQIIEHKSDGSAVVARQFCGEDDPRAYKSEGDFISVRFHKTVNYDGTGWVIYFNSVYDNYAIPSYFF